MSNPNNSPSDEKSDIDKKSAKPMATVTEVFGFMWGLGPGNRFLFFVGCLAGVANGLVYPILAYLFSTSFSSIASSQDGLQNVETLAYTFMIVGVYALVAAFLQTGCLEIVATRATRTFRLQWFNALLSQDAAFFDVYDISGMAASIQPSSAKFNRGTGRKLGEGIQFTTTFVGGIAFAFYSSWKVAFVILGILPLVSLAGFAVMTINQTKGARASAAYSIAGGTAYATVSSIKTVLSLNAVLEMISQYKDATMEAFKQSVAPLVKQGFAFGSMLSSFICLYGVLTLFGSFLIYQDVASNGCDPSDSGYGTGCANSGPDVFGAMLGVAFAAQGVSQVGNFIETFTACRVAVYPAMQAMRRKIGAPSEMIYTEKEGRDEKGVKSTSSDPESGSRLRAILPEYRIDARSKEGMKPSKVVGRLEFCNVQFSYPTRPNNPVLKGLNLVIEEGKTTALVGPSGGGKSTTVALIERFYDPLEGMLTLDGVDIKEINVAHLRSLIGYVGQEPTLFATTIAGNIKYGKPNATQEEIEAAARSANAHDFITSFPDGYDTQVGDKGAQLSGGQKQRIAIARVLVANPSILLLDEATSALDSESEMVVQDALDNVVAESKRTTIVIAHRLSTIRQADSIAVISDGRVVEQGTHEELMASGGHYFTLVDKQENRSTSNPASRSSSVSNLSSLDNPDTPAKIVESISDNDVPHFEFQNVVFAYPSRPKKRVFDRFNLKIKAGETVALVGPSGGGKSTTVAMIERFYDPLEGSVMYKGFDIKSLNLQWYRDQIGYVGQEPTLFNTTIAKNIAYGAPGASQEQIVEAAKQANIHDTIMSFPDGYNTEVGERGTQLSGGQKQRVAIARALVKKPKVLLLDEATSALDNESEALVQEALDQVMASKEHTTLVIAHRLSTIKDVDRIAFIAGGKVLEYGSHKELYELNGRYRRLVDTQNRHSSVTADILRKGDDRNAKDDDDDSVEADFEAEMEEAVKSSFSMKRARDMAGPDALYMMIGAMGAVFAGGVFPAWGIMFAETISLLFTIVPTCDEILTSQPSFKFESCQAYFDDVAANMRQTSFELTGYWVIIAVGCLLGNVVTFWGFGMASERLNKRVRDMSFASLVRQEVAFFDRRSVGAITSQLQDDAARIHTFSGEPIRTFVIAFSSIVSGVVVSFVYMWPFALLAIGCIPLMGFATSIEMNQMLGEDEADDDGGSSQDELNSPGGILVETLLNIRTVSALTLEDQRSKDFERAVIGSQPRYVYDGMMSGLTGGASMFIQQWINALQMWFGGWLIFESKGAYSFDDFLVANFAILFSLFGLGAAFNGLSDRKQTELSAGRIFYLLDRKSQIDPLSEEGKKLD